MTTVLSDVITDKQCPDQGTSTPNSAASTPGPSTLGLSATAPGSLVSTSGPTTVIPSQWLTVPGNGFFTPGPRSSGTRFWDSIPGPVASAPGPLASTPEVLAPCPEVSGPCYQASAPGFTASASGCAAAVKRLHHPSEGATLTIGASAVGPEAPAPDSGASTPRHRASEQGFWATDTGASSRYRRALTPGPGSSFRRFLYPGDGTKRFTCDDMLGSFTHIPGSMIDLNEYDTPPTRHNSSFRSKYSKNSLVENDANIANNNNNIVGGYNNEANLVNCEKGEMELAPPPLDPVFERMRVPDGGWGWMIVFCSACITAVVGSSYTSFSMCYVELVDTFDTSKAATGWIGSIYMATGNFLSIFFSLAVRAYGSRPVCIVGALITGGGFIISSLATGVTFLYLSYGLLAGFGVGMIVLSTMVIVQQYFDKHRALAAGIAATGFSVGNLAGGPLMHALIQAYTWRGALLIYAGIYFQVIIFGLLFRPLREPQFHSKSPISVIAPHSLEKSMNPHKNHQDSIIYVKSLRCQRILWKKLSAVFDFSLFQDAPFSLYIISQFLVHIGMVTFFQQTPSRAIHLGIKPHLAALLPLISGSWMGISRFSLSFVANASCTDRLLQYSIASAMGGLMHATTLLATDFLSMAIYNAVEGACIGAAFCIMSTLLVDLQGIENIARSQSMLSLALGCAMLLAIPFSGYLFDVSQNYDLPFLVTGILHTTGSLCAAVAVCMRRKKEKLDM